MFLQQGLQGLPQGEVFLLPRVGLRGEVAYPEPAADAAGQGFGGDGMVSRGGGPQAARPSGGQAGGARFGAAEQRRACGPYPGFCRGQDYIFARATAMRAAQRALLSASWTLEAKDSPPVSSLILASRNGVICLPWMWAASASASA